MDSQQFTNEESVDVEAIRSRLAKMSDEDLIKYGRAAANLCDPIAQRGEVRETFRVQLAEARAEYRRRHPVT